MNELAAHFHAQRATSEPPGPWMLRTSDGHVRVYAVRDDLKVKLIGESTIEEVECPTSPEPDSAPSE